MHQVFHVCNVKLQMLVVQKKVFIKLNWNFTQKPINAVNFFGMCFCHLVLDLGVQRVILLQVTGSSFKIRVFPSRYPTTTIFNHLDEPMHHTKPFSSFLQKQWCGIYPGQCHQEKLLTRHRCGCCGTVLAASTNLSREYLTYAQTFAYVCLINTHISSFNTFKTLTLLSVFPFTDKPPKESWNCSACAVQMSVLRSHAQCLYLLPIFFSANQMHLSIPGWWISYMWPTQLLAIVPMLLSECMNFRSN